MISMAFRDAFGCFMFAAFSVKNIPVVIAVMISPSLIESSMFFLQSKLLVYCIGSSSDLRSYYIGKDSKHATAVDIINVFGCPTPTALSP